MLKGAELWKAGDLTAFGQLMNISSYSSLHNYEACALISQGHLSSIPLNHTAQLG